jgi:hypothetical protein
MSLGTFREEQYLDTVGHLFLYHEQFYYGTYAYPVGHNQEKPLQAKYSGP